MHRASEENTLNINSYGFFGCLAIYVFLAILKANTFYFNILLQKWSEKVAKWLFIMLDVVSIIISRILLK